MIMVVEPHGMSVHPRGHKKVFFPVYCLVTPPLIFKIGWSVFHPISRSCLGPYSNPAGQF